MTTKRWRRGTALVAVLSVAGLLAASVPAAATPEEEGPGPAASPGVGPLRPEIIDPQLRAEVDATADATAGVTAAGEGEPVEYLVEVGAQPDLAAVRFDREAVVAALKETVTSGRWD